MINNCCNLWKNGIEHINTFIVMSSVRSSGIKFKLEYGFKFCPWCGVKKLEENKINYEPEIEKTNIQFKKKEVNKNVKI